MEAIEYFQEQGRKGGKAAASRMTAKQRQKRACKAAAQSAKVRSAKALLKRAEAKRKKGA
jgi:hypothetical protein